MAAFIGGFTKQLMQFEDSSLKKIDQVTRMIALEVFRRIILKTPVDTGRARGNWLCTIAAPAAAMAQGEGWFQGSADAGGYDKSGRAAIEEAANQVMAWNPKDVAIFLTNNLPYIEALENGHSSQAPAGMVAITIAEFDGIVARVAS
jgi:hypothetical protein